MQSAARNLGSKLPSGGGAAAAARALLGGAFGLYSLAQGLYTVDGGHRGIVFNRFSGIKSTARARVRDVYVRSLAAAAAAAASSERRAARAIVVDTTAASPPARRCTRRARTCLFRG